MVYKLRSLPKHVRDVWVKAIFVEFDSLVDKGTIVLYPAEARDKDERIYPSKIVFKLGEREPSYPDGRAKARLVIDGSRDKGTVPKHLNHSSMGTHCLEKGYSF